MSNQWHYSEEGAQYGPVDEAEIIRLIQSSELAPVYLGLQLAIGDCDRELHLASW